MNLLFLFQQPDDTAAAADTATKAGVGVFEKIGGTIGLVFCAVLMIGAAAMLVVQTIGMFARRASDRETERRWEMENVPGGGGGEYFPGVKYGGKSFLLWMSIAVMPLLGLFVMPTPWGFDSWKEYMKTLPSRIAAQLTWLVLALVLGSVGGVFLGMADKIKETADAAAKAVGQQDVTYPAMYTVWTLIGGIFLGAMMVVPIVVAAMAFKGMMKKAAEYDAVQVDIDPGTRSALWSEWLRDKIWVEKKQSSQRTAKLIPGLVVYAVMLVGTFILYGILCIFIPGARDIGSGWFLLLIPPIVCAPPFLPLFGALLIGVPMRRKIREGGTVAS